MIFSSNYIAVLDACVLYPAPVRDLLLSFAANGLYNPKWSAEIQDEWSRNLLLNRSDLKKELLRSNNYYFWVNYVYIVFVSVYGEKENLIRAEKQN